MKNSFWAISGWFGWIVGLVLGYGACHGQSGFELATGLDGGSENSAIRSQWLGTQWPDSPDQGIEGNLNHCWLSAGTAAGKCGRQGLHDPGCPGCMGESLHPPTPRLSSVLATVPRWVDDRFRLAVESTAENFRLFLSRAEELAVNLETGLGEARCVRAAGDAASNELRSIQYWSYYEAWDRWVAKTPPTRSSPGSHSLNRNSGLDRVLATALVAPPAALRRLIVGAGAEITLQIERLAECGLNAPEQLCSELVASQLQRGLCLLAPMKVSKSTPICRKVSCGSPPRSTKSPTCSTVLGLGCQQVSDQALLAVTQTAGFVQFAVGSLAEVLTLIPIAAIGHVWPGSKP